MKETPLTPAILEILIIGETEADDIIVTSIVEGINNCLRETRKRKADKLTITCSFFENNKRQQQKEIKSFHYDNGKINCFNASSSLRWAAVEDFFAAIALFEAIEDWKGKITKDVSNAKVTFNLN